MFTSLAASLLVRVSKGWGGSIRKIYLQGLGVAPAGRGQLDQGAWQQTDKCMVRGTGPGLAVHV